MIVEGCSFSRRLNPQRNFCTTPNPVNKDCGGCDSAQSFTKPKIGNPVDPSTGEKSELEIDFESKATGLRVTRTHSSQLPGDQGLGLGWSSNLLKSLYIFDDTMVYREANGRGEEWIRDAVTGEWVGDVDTDLQITNEAGGGYKVTKATGDVERYGRSGELLSETTPSGQTTTYDYNVHGHLVKVTNHFGHALTVTWLPQNRLRSVTDANGQQVIYAYGIWGGQYRLKRIEYVDGTTRKYDRTYGANRQLLLGITDENNSKYATFTYDSSARALSTKHAVTDNGSAQEEFTISYDSESPITRTITDAAGNSEVWKYEQYVGVSKLTEITNNTDNKVATRTYDANGNLLTVTDPEGRVTTRSYNAHNQLISKTEASGTPESRTTTYEYVSNDIDLVTKISESSVAAGLLKEQITVYDANLNKTSVSTTGFKPDGTPVTQTTSFQYNGIGQVTQIDGPRTDVSDITTFTYNDCNTGGACGMLASITNALGHTTTFDSYDPGGRLLQQTDANGVVTTYTYDIRDRVLSTTVTPPAGAGAARVTAYTYDPTGKLLTTTFPDGRVVTNTYDAAYDLKTVEDNLGNKTAHQYDIKGNRISTEVINPDGTVVRETESIYDHRNYVITVDQAGSLTEMVKDATGNTLSQEDPNNNPLTLMQYDGLDRLTQATDPAGGITSNQYDSQGNLTQVTAPNSAATSYTYDDLGNRLQEISSDRGTTNYTYDTANNLISSTDARGITAIYTYDALNRMLSVDWPGTDEDVTYVYDACGLGLGRLCQVTDQSGVTDYSYDAFGNITSEVLTDGADVSTTAYTYDPANRVASMTYPSGLVVDTTRDAVGRVTEVDATYLGQAYDLIDSRTYRADGQFTNQVYGNGLTETRTYDLQGRLTDQSLVGGAGSSINMSVQLGYDANGNVLQRTNTEMPGTFSYDALDRLITDSTDFGSLTFSYDPNGNRLTELSLAGTDTYSYQPNSNQLSAINASSITLDAAGNTTSDIVGSNPSQTRTFAYNNGGHLSQFSLDGSLVAEYEYNHQRQRTKKARYASGVLSSTEHFQYDRSGSLIAESENGNPVHDYIWVDGAPIGQFEYLPNGTIDHIVWMTNDHLNTPRIGTGQSGQQIEWLWDSSGFGEGAEDTDPDLDGTHHSIALRFPGQYLDDESGIHYNWNRYYDPQTGRYITSDPIGLEGGVNTYGYADTNSLMYTDPTGESAVAGVSAAFSADLAAPEPSDAAWPKWLLWGGLFLGAAIYDVCTEEDDAAKLPTFPLVADFTKCQLGERIEIEIGNKTKQKRFKDGLNIEQEYICPEGVFTRHTIISKNGQIVHDHFRPGPPRGTLGG